MMTGESCKIPLISKTLDPYLNVRVQWMSTETTSKVVARALFVPFVRRFLNEYCTAFPECDHTQLMRAVVERDDDSGQYILELFWRSLSPFEDRLKSRDETVFVEWSCEFVQHLEINRIWTDDLSAHVKHRIWQYLNGAYWLADLVNRLPSNIQQSLQLLVLHNDATDELADRVQELLNVHWDEQETRQFATYLWDMFTSDSTPVYCFLPARLHHIVDSAVDHLCSLGCQWFAHHVVSHPPLLETKAWATVFTEVVVSLRFSQPLLDKLEQFVLDQTRKIRRHYQTHVMPIVLLYLTRDTTGLIVDLL